MGAVADGRCARRLHALPVTRAQGEPKSRQPALAA